MLRTVWPTFLSSNSCKTPQKITPLVTLVALEQWSYVMSNSDVHHLQVWIGPLRFRKSKIRQDVLFSFYAIHSSGFSVFNLFDDSAPIQGLQPKSFPCATSLNRIARGMPLNLFDKVMKINQRTLKLCSMMTEKSTITKGTCTPVHASLDHLN